MFYFCWFLNVTPEGNRGVTRWLMASAENSDDGEKTVEAVAVGLGWCREDVFGNFREERGRERYWERLRHCSGGSLVRSSEISERRMSEGKILVC